MKIDIQKESIRSEGLPVLSCHASTLAEAPDGSVIAAWFAGSREGADDVVIYSSIRRDGVWLPPRAVTRGRGTPQWNPVLFYVDEKTLALFYKEGKPIANWHTMVQYSLDDGATWSEARELVPDDVSGGRGPVKNKPLRLAGGAILAPASTEQGPWRPFADRSADNGLTWEKHSIPVTGPEASVTNIIQPSFWEYPEGQVHALMRSNRGRIYASDSTDSGETWSSARMTVLVNNNSGLDLVHLGEGRVLLVCNPVEGDFAARSPLSVFVSEDNGAHFEHAANLEDRPGGEFSYPAVIKGRDCVRVTYTCDREYIKYAEIRLR